MTSENFYKRSTLPPLVNPQAALPIPEKIGPYPIVRLLEKGGMSVLYLGLHPETQEATTIKVLSQKFLSNAEVVQRFLKEAEIISMADHPHIVKLFGHGEWENGRYIAMEYIEGISLRQYILQNPLSLRKALEIVIDIAYALCHLHTHGVIHRDLKPENILMTNRETIKVIDFGIAQLLTEKDDESEKLRQRVIGTPIYMSPEQRENPQTVSYPSDIYSLGIITYELVLGKLSHGQIYLSLMPKGLQKILRKALQPNVEDRYQDIVDFIFDISNYLNSDLVEKEKKITDQISDLSDNLKKAQGFLIAESNPTWPSLEIGLSVYKSLKIAGIYQDFFEAGSDYLGLMAGETTAKNAEGFLYSAVLRGMIRAVCRLAKHPKEITTVLNDMILKEKIPHLFTLTYFIFPPKENYFWLTTCGTSHVWYIPQGAVEPIKLSLENPALGTSEHVEFRESQITWNRGDRLFLANYSISHQTADETQIQENALHQEIKNNLSLPPQKLVDTVLRHLKVSTKMSDHTLSFICLQKSE